MPTFRAMMNGDDLIGSCLHYIDNSQIDCGGVIARCEQGLDKSRSYLWNVLQLYIPACRELARVVSNIDSGVSIECVAQEGEAAYYSFPTSNEIEAFFEKGFTLVSERDLIDMSELYLSGK